VVANLTAVESRARDPTFVAQCNLSGLQDYLPFRWIVPSDIPPSPKKTYRSNYVYLGWQDLQDPTVWKHLSPFDLILRLVDFTPLRPVLAQLLGWTSARGWVPFDPISIFLVTGWQITNHWSRARTLRNLRKPKYAEYAHHFGFENGVFPTEGGLRHWLTVLGQNSTNGETILVDKEQHLEIASQQLNLLLAQSVLLLVENGFLSPETWEKALICPDGMIHDAASRMRCASVRHTCYQPVAPDTPRPCPAKEKGRLGCNCDTIACASACRYATPRDPEARFVWYSGSNHKSDNPNQSIDPTQAKKKRGKGHYGYRSLPLQLADSSRRFSVVLLDDFLPANQREENFAAALLLQLRTYYPGLSVDTVVGDAGFGYDRFLQVVHRDLNARRAIDLRADKSDRDKASWPVRGYDDKGRPICPFGYSLKANGFDFERRRHKWCCSHSCCNGATPIVHVEGATYPPEECPYLKPNHPHGQIINVGERFQDNSIRLVRDIPVGTPSWQRLYHRARNAAEGRNAFFQAWGLKRLLSYGNPRNKALVFQADVWLNLSTMARLVLEATAATTST
jgi:hypothetical protein